MRKIILIIIFLCVLLNNGLAENVVREEVFINDDRSSWEAIYYVGETQVAHQKVKEDGTRLMAGSIPDGIVLVYYESGELMKELQYKNGLLEGQGRYYAQDGTLLRDMNYHKDMLHGPVKEYLYSGQLKSEEYWVNDRLDGVQKKYLPNGELNMEAMWSNGVRNGMTTIYHQGTKIREVLFYTDGELIHSKIVNDQQEDLGSPSDGSDENNY